MIGKSRGPQSLTQDQTVRIKLRKRARQFFSIQAIAGLATEVAYISCLIAAAALLMAIIRWWVR